MPFPLLAGLFVVLAFLSGSVPYGLLIAKRHGIDIRQHGSGNIGATNVRRVLGRGPGNLCFALDVLKGLVPSLGAGLAFGTLGSMTADAGRCVAWLLVAVASVVGHVFSPWIGFRGGKGVATGLGSLVGVMPPLAVPALLALAVWVGTLKVWRTVAISSVLAGLSLPLFAVLQVPVARAIGVDAGWSSAMPFIVGASLLAVLVVWTHRSNLARLRRGDEPRVGAAKDNARDNAKNTGKSTGNGAGTH